MENESVIEEETNGRKNDELILYKLDELKKGNTKQDETTNKILVLLTGNGNPEKGLIVKTTRLTDKLDGHIDEHQQKKTTSRTIKLCLIAAVITATLEYVVLVLI